MASPLLLLLGGMGLFLAVRSSQDAAGASGPTGPAGPTGPTGMTGMTVNEDGATGAAGTNADRAPLEVARGALGPSLDTSEPAPAGECVEAAMALNDAAFVYTPETSKRGLMIGQDVVKFLSDPLRQKPDSYTYMLYVLNSELNGRLASAPKSPTPTKKLATPGASLSVESRLRTLIGCLTALSEKKFPTFSFKAGVFTVDKKFGAGDLSGGFGADSAASYEGLKK